MEPITSPVLPTARLIAAIMTTVPNSSMAPYINGDLVGRLSLALAASMPSNRMEALRAAAEAETDEQALAAYWRSLDLMDFACVLAIGASRLLPDTLGGLLRGSVPAHCDLQTARIAARGERVPYATAAILEECLAAEDHATVFWVGGSPHSGCAKLFDSIGWQITDLIEAQPDLPGINSLVRQGLVRSLYLPDGTRVVSKRDNPAKRGRFLAEQTNVLAISERLGLGDCNASIKIGDVGGLAVECSVVRPLAVLSIPEHSVFYAIARFSPHPTLESLLMSEGSGAKRRTMLRGCGILLEHLYANGIVWGDMAPRNMLVEDVAGCLRFHLLDFEKTSLYDGCVPHSARVEHGRGPMCVEEFGAVCSRSEVTETFAPYFAPDSWDLMSSDALSLAKPKREVIDILTAAGVTTPSMGEYNRTETAVLNVRFPHDGIDGVRRLPLHQSFKIDHYLGAEYDRKATEALMAAHRHGLMEVVIDVLSVATESTENDMLLAAVCSARSRDNNTMDRLRCTVDALWAARHDAADLSSLARRLSLAAACRHHRAACLLFPEKGSEALRRNATMVLDLLVPAIKSACAEDSAVLVVVIAGLSRMQFTSTSDIDIATFAPDGHNVERLRRNIERAAQTLIGTEVEWFPSTSLADLRNIIDDSPEAFLDVASAVVVAGPPTMATEFREIVDGAVASKAYRRRVLAHYSGKAGASPKQLFAAANVASIVANDRTSATMALAAYAKEMSSAGYPIMAIDYERLVLQVVSEINAACSSAHGAITG